MRKYNNVARWSVIEKSQQPFLFNAKKVETSSYPEYQQEGLLAS